MTDQLAAIGRDSADLLTPRELQIARLVARGCPDKQIAFRLKISEWTVATHVRRILDKLAWAIAQPGCFVAPRFSDAAISTSLSKPVTGGTEPIRSHRRSSGCKPASRQDAQ